MKFQNSFYSFYSFKVVATKLLLQTQDGGPHKIFFLEFWHFEFGKSYKNLIFDIVLSGKFKNLHFIEKDHHTVKRTKIWASGMYVVNIWVPLTLNMSG